MQVGSDYDSKERIFRNYPGFFGPDTKIVLHHSWINGPVRKVTFAWIDSAGKVAAVHHVRIARTRLVQRHNPKLKGPLRPGIWTTKVSIGQREIAQVKFLIIPVETGVKHKGRVVDFLSQVDKLTARFWTLQETCLVSHDRKCPQMPSCKATEWSSLSPDPKSDINKHLM